MVTKSTKPKTAVFRTESTPLLRTTKHAYLTEQLRDLVATLQPGDRLPAQNELMRRYGVSDRTVLRSVEDLQRAGLIVRRPGSGTYVTDAIDASSESESPTATKTLTVFGPHFYAASYMRLAADLLAAEAETMGLTLVYHVARQSARQAFIQNEVPADALRSRGCVLMGYLFAPLAERLRAEGQRAVVVGSPPEGIDPTIPCVCADHEMGGYLATRHLLTLGHRRLAFAFNDQMRYPLMQHPRGLGHERAMGELRRADETVTNALIDAETLASWREDAALARAYFRQPDAPTGIATWNDSVAFVLLGILNRAGLRVPEDVSVIGFDNLPEGQDTVPPLTTINQHVEWQMKSVFRLLTRATDPPAQAVVALPELVRRSSCGPPPSMLM